MSPAVYVSNILYGTKTLSAFDMAFGYTSTIVGLPKYPVPADILAVNRNKVARCALNKLYTGRNPRVLAVEYLSRDTCFYSFRWGVKFGSWNKGFVRAIEPNIVVIYTSSSDKRNPVRAAYEDVRLTPDSPLLLEMNEVVFVFPRSY